MTFLPDSIFAIILFAATLLSWWMTRATPSGARINFRFAAALMAALAGARLVSYSGLVLTVANLVCGLAAMAIALAYCFPRRAPCGLATTVLVLALALGMLAIFAPQTEFLTQAFQASAALAIMASACSRIGDSLRARLFAGAGGLSSFLGAMAVMHGSFDTAMLFFTTALLGTGRSLQIPVAETRRRWLPVVSGERV